MLSVRKKELGFTLIEIMIALAIAGILLVSIYNLYISQSTTYTVQEQVSDMQQNARVAMDIVSRHIRMAGLGQPSWTTINGTSGITYKGISVTDGGTGNPDTLTVVGCIDPPPGKLGSAAAASSTTITLQSSAEASKFNTTTKSDIFIGELENAKVTGISGAVLTIDTNPIQTGNQGTTNAFSAGANVYLVKRVTYTIDSTSVTIERDENTGSGNEEIAVNVEDLQVTFTTPTVNLSITARTRSKDPNYTGDGYHRMTLTSNIIARNLE
ncbi:MAG: prepilin-type N-terminal cleavage/methylation domain-containing protein [Thermodesulfobacteriota bacterium]